MSLMPSRFEPKAGAYRRSMDSFAFEAAWKSLRKGGLVPSRRDFAPRAFGRLLRNTILVEFSLENPVWSRIRVAGDGIRERVQRDITGDDYFKYLPEKYHPRAIERLRHTIDRPCGFWRVMAVHYQRGYSQNLEVTTFPLLNEGGPPQIVGLMTPHDGLVTPVPLGLSVMSVGAAAVFTYLDVGAGVPDERPLP